MTPERARRLAFVKYLLSLGTAQTNQPEPLSSAALLLFHDATELFLQVAAEHLNVAIRRDQGFMEYWDLLDRVLAPNTLPYRGSMDRLNKARVALKHHGNLPSRLDLEEFSRLTVGFLDESTRLIFGMLLDAISMLDFVICEPATRSLERAVKGLQAGDIKAGLAACAEAFDELTTEYEARIILAVGGVDLSQRAQFPTHYLNSAVQSEDRRIVQAFAEWTSSYVETLRTAVRVLLLDLDPRRYARFRALTPGIIAFHSGDKQHNWTGRQTGEMSSESLRFCIDFVIESALKFQRLANQ